MNLLKLEDHLNISHLVAEWLDITLLMAQTHCTGPGVGQGQGMVLGTMGFYITLCTVHRDRDRHRGPLFPIVPEFTSRSLSLSRSRSLSLSRSRSCAVCMSHKTPDIVGPNPFHCNFNCCHWSGKPYSAHFQMWVRSVRYETKRVT